MPPRWLTRAMVLALHGESLAVFGGSPGLRDAGLLESALARPKNQLGYEPSPTLVQLAATYGFGLARGHAFVDGNKRVAVLATAVFLALNGLRFDPDELDEVRTLLAVAAGELSQEAFASWIGANTTKAAPRP